MEEGASKKYLALKSGEINGVEVHAPQARDSRPQGHNTSPTDEKLT